MAVGEIVMTRRTNMTFGSSKLGNALASTVEVTNIVSRSFLIAATLLTVRISKESWSTPVAPESPITRFAKALAGDVVTNLFYTTGRITGAICDKIILLYVGMTTIIFFLI